MAVEAPADVVSCAHREDVPSAGTDAVVAAVMAEMAGASGEQTLEPNGGGEENMTDEEYLRWTYGSV